MTVNRTTPDAVTEVVDSALGRLHREDPVLARTGGPAGNARLTAWLGLTLLVLALLELVTLVDLSGLITWHIALGVLLVPPALAKTATTGWRMVRYYTGSRPYVEAGPPPLLLRLLGPLVVLSTLALLGSGGLLVGLGPTATFQPWFTVLGFAISPLTLHQACFAVWAGATGLHVLARMVPAWMLASARDRVPGGPGRGVVVLGTAVAAAGLAVVVVGLAGAWTDGVF